jgi:peptidoglycan/xylan/chitin deacetylase (PgdA/CDA1 family)
MTITTTLRKIRHAALGLCERSSIASRFGRSGWRRSRLLILCYHGISQADEHLWSDLYVSREHLDRRLKLLRDAGANVLPLSEGLDRMYADDLPPLAVSLTFDDGAVDFSRMALPILREWSTPATLYLTTWYCDRPLPVFDTTLSYLLWKGRGRTIAVPEVAGALLIPERQDQPPFIAVHERLRAHAGREEWSALDKNQFLASLARSIGIDFDDLRRQRLLHLMTAEEIRGLDAPLVDVQLHTHRHRTPSDRVGFMREIEDNRRAIGELSGRDLDLRHFCYPSGDYRPEFGGWLDELGVRSGTTCDPGLASARDDRFFLPRIIDTMAMSDEVFLGWVHGVAHFVHRRSPAIVRPRR